MTIYEYMGQLGYTKNIQYPNGFEKLYNDRKILIIFNFKEKSAHGCIGAMRLIHKQKDIDDIKEAYHVMLADLQKISDIGVTIR